MKINQSIRKIFFISLWVIIGAGITALLIAAIRIKREKVCKGSQIEINKTGDTDWFIDKNDIVQVMTKNGWDTITGKEIILFDLKKMETVLEKHRWIEDAQLFFDNKQLLQIKITERIPIARIFTVTGAGFYIDSNCVRLPVSGKMAARLPVFTGFPSDKAKLKRADRLLLNDIKLLSNYISQHPFWMAQIAQVDINSGRNFEVIPTIGNHIIEFGNASNYAEKFKKLFVFYRDVLSKAGMETYARIDVRYDRQIIGVRNNYLSKTDSVKHLKSVQYLIATSQKQEAVKNDSVITSGIEADRIKKHEVTSVDTGARYVKQ